VKKSRLPFLDPLPDRSCVGVSWTGVSWTDRAWHFRESEPTINT
jgi:hypothetical protein